jgi:putative SOS response-associated peptidase YedK
MEMLHPYPAEEMKLYPVSTLVNKPENDIPQVIESSQPI